MYRVGTPRAIALVVGASLIAGASLLAYSQPAALQQPATATAYAPVDEQELLHRAMLTRVAVSTNRRTGRLIPAFHCRKAAEGCEQRLDRFAHYLVSAGRAHGIDPWLMAAMALKESGLNPFAMGAVGELGILQINPGRRDARQVRFIRDEWYRKRCRREPGACQREVVDHAARVLARSMVLCKGDVQAALGAYNSGRCNRKSRYSQRILAELEELRHAAGLDAHPEAGHS